MPLFIAQPGMEPWAGRLPVKRPNYSDTQRVCKYTRRLIIKFIEKIHTYYEGYNNLQKLK